MPDYTTTNLIILCVLGIIIKLFFGSDISNDGLSGPASSTMWGYGISAISIFFLAFINFANTSKETGSGDNSFTFMFTFITNTLPSIFTLLLLMYIIWLNISYFKRINQGRVASEFYSMSKMSTVLLLFQIFTLFKSIHSISKSKKTSTQSSNEINEGNESGIIYLLTLINIIFIMILNIILEYFSTDD